MRSFIYALNYCKSIRYALIMEEFTKDGVQTGIKIVFLYPTFLIFGYGYHSNKR